MEAFNRDIIDEVVLALLYLNVFGDATGTRAWKSFDWDATDRLHEKGFISSPKGKAKSVVFSEDGLKEAEKMAKKYFQK